MTPSQTWVNFCTLLTGLYPDCKVHRMYVPFDDFEHLSVAERPEVYVQLNNFNTSQITLNKTLEDSYQFRITYLWKMRDVNDMVELDKKLNAMQDYLTVFSNKTYDLDDVQRFYFSQATCELVYDEDLLANQGVFVSTYIVPISVYRDVSQH